MSILIRGLKAPYGCEDCIVPLSKCDYLMNRAEKCPLEEIDVVRCIECRFLGFNGFDGCCELGIISGILKPWDYCSRGQYVKGDL